MKLFGRAGARPEEPEPQPGRPARTMVGVAEGTTAAPMTEEGELRIVPPGLNLIGILEGTPLVVSTGSWMRALGVIRNCEVTIEPDAYLEMEGWLKADLRNAGGLLIFRGGFEGNIVDDGGRTIFANGSTIVRGSEQWTVGPDGYGPPGERSVAPPPGYMRILADGSLEPWERPEGLPPSCIPALGDVPTLPQPLP